jgi:hypothetical protein
MKVLIQEGPSSYPGKLLRKKERKGSSPQEIMLDHGDIMG